MEKVKISDITLKQTGKDFSLSFKEKLVDTTWYNGIYINYNDVLSSSVKSKVGLLNVSDIKYSDLKDYYLMTPTEDGRIYLYSDTLVDSKPNLLRDIVPTIALDKLNVLNGDGTYNNPYEIEV